MDTFVETGTYLGDSTNVAAEIFKQIHTIELSEKLYKRVVERFKGNPNICCYLGDSATVMKKLVPTLTGRVLFWLDGHFSGGITSRGESNTPILSELERIALLPNQQSVILIDDLRLFQKPKFGFKDAQSLAGYPTVIALEQAIQKIFPEHQFIIYGDIAIVLTGGLTCGVSPVVKGMTISRLWDDKLEPSCELIDAEKEIMLAQGEELRALANLYDNTKSDLDYGLSGHYQFWQLLTLIGNKKLADAQVEYEELIASGLINSKRIERYFRMLTHQNDEILRCSEPYTNNSFTAKNETQNVCPKERPLRLHLGCGKQYLQGYINIDYPIEQREIEDVKADLYADITALNYSAESVDEIRLHHVFEHFNRVVALAQLIRWHEWLKPGGKLHIETPDIEGSARILLSDLPWHVKSATIRHLAGDQASQWAYHVDHWCPERFKRTLSKLGFINIESNATHWPHEPYLANVTVTAFKQHNLARSTLLSAAHEILRESAVSTSESSLVSIWQQQLSNHLETGAFLENSAAVLPETHAPSYLSNLPLDEIHLFNQKTRDRWVAQKASTVPPNSRVLDVGAGTCPYRSLFTHCEYKAHDFKKYSEQKQRDGSYGYGIIDYESDITSIPVPDASFDVVLCTEVLEHVPEPSAALKEIARVLRPGGRAFLTVPLGSGLHQLPYHFYGGLSPSWYHYWGEKFGLSVQEITPNGGFFRLLAQECVRAASLLQQSSLIPQVDKDQLKAFLSERLPRILFALEDETFIDQFTVGYHVVLHKPATTMTMPSDGLNGIAGERYHQLIALKQCFSLKLHMKDEGSLI